MVFRGQNRPTDSVVEPATADTLCPVPSEADVANRYTDRLRMFISRRIQDSASAEDIAQETLRNVIEAMRSGRIENLAALPGFVFTTAKNLCMHWTRSVAREKSALSRFGDDEPQRRVDAVDPLSRLIAEDRRKSVRLALDTLAPEDRQLLSLLYYEGVPSDAAADRLGTTRSAVRVRKHRALRRLARALGEHVGNETDLTGTMD
jgi:RNA polymerase sigma factor (sigma-70 family)